MSWADQYKMNWKRLKAKKGMFYKMTADRRQWNKKKHIVPTPRKLGIGEGSDEWWWANKKHLLALCTSIFIYICVQMTSVLYSTILKDFVVQLVWID